VKRWIALVVWVGVSCGIAVRPVAPAGRAVQPLGVRIAGLWRHDLLAPLTRVVARELARRASRAAATATWLRPLLGSDAPATRGVLLARLGLLSDVLAAERARGDVSARTVTALRELRVAYHAHCVRGCTRDAIFAELTKQLGAAYTAQGDAASATAERALLATLHPTW
jgi:hypothetical protein